jgi:hypothetical protein
MLCVFVCGAGTVSNDCDTRVKWCGVCCVQAALKREHEALQAAVVCAVIVTSAVCISSLLMFGRRVFVKLMPLNSQAAVGDAS